MSSGWIMLHRQIRYWEWYKDANTFRLFIHLLLSANHDKGSFKGISVDRGQAITGIQTLSDSLSMSASKIRTSLNKLKNSKEIAIKSTSKYSIVTIINYDTYQCKKNDNDKQNEEELTNKSQTNDKQIATNNNEKNLTSKETNYGTEIQTWWNDNIAIHGYSKIKKVTGGRAKKAKAREIEKHLFEIEEMVAGFSDFVKDGNWFGFDWIIKNDENIIKVLEGKFSKTNSNTKNKGGNKVESTDISKFRGE